MYILRMLCYIGCLAFTHTHTHTRIYKNYNASINVVHSRTAPKRQFARDFISFASLVPEQSANTVTANLAFSSYSCWWVWVPSQDMGSHISTTLSVWSQRACMNSEEQKLTGGTFHQCKPQNPNFFWVPEKAKATTQFELSVSFALYYPQSFSYPLSSEYYK